MKDQLMEKIMEEVMKKMDAPKEVAPATEENN